MSILKKNISLEEYKLNHISGDIGKALCKIKDVLDDNYAKIVFKDADIELNKIFIQMIEKKTGCCFFTDENDYLLGLLTDGDIRRLIIKNDKLSKISREHINTSFYYEDNNEKYICECKKGVTYIPVLTGKKLTGVINNINC